MQTTSANRMTQKGLSLVPGGGIEPPQDFRPANFKSESPKPKSYLNESITDT